MIRKVRLELPCTFLSPRVTSLHFHIYLINLLAYFCQLDPPLFKDIYIEVLELYQKP